MNTSSQSDQSFVDGWRERQAALAAVAAAWREARMGETVEAGRRLARMPGVRRVVLFGSLARGEAGPGSDVDLWVEGLAEECWLDAQALVREVVKSAEVDLVRSETAGPELAAVVATEGLVLHAC